MNNLKRIYTKSYVEEQSLFFWDYLSNQYASSGIMDDIERLCRTKKGVYIFSGIIRDFFLNSKQVPRDIDIVLTGDLSSTDILSPQSFYVNQFGGKKYIKADRIIDMWSLSQTWGIKQMNMCSSVESLLRTAFFNFSAIVYDCKHRKFIVSDDFLKFLNTHIIDYVFEKNPYPELCIINCMYYQERLKCELSFNLKKWIYKHYVENMYDYKDVQQHHFGKVLYSEDEIEKFITLIKKEG